MGNECLKVHKVYHYSQDELNDFESIHACDELVLCKDCKHFEESDNPSDRGYCWFIDAKFPSDGYCSYAEKAE